MLLLLPGDIIVAFITNLVGDWRDGAGGVLDACTIVALAAESQLFVPLDFPVLLTLSAPMLAPGAWRRKKWWCGREGKGCRRRVTHTDRAVLTARCP